MAFLIEEYPNMHIPPEVFQEIGCLIYVDEERGRSKEDETSCHRRLLCLIYNTTSHSPFIELAVLTAQSSQQPLQRSKGLLEEGVSWYML